MVADSRVFDASIPVIAIDGPSASGKGTVASRVAEAFGFHFLDSGALYRLVALVGLRTGIALDDEGRMAVLAAELPARFMGDQILLGDENVSLALRGEDVSVGASKVAALPAVRSVLLARQRAFRLGPGLVADGRDMGSVVFPDAVLKVFLTASAEARAERRYKQLIEKGLPATMPSLLRDLEERDRRDAGRSVAPLMQQPDALLLDTSDMTIVEGVDAVLAMAKARGISS